METNKNHRQMWKASALKSEQKIQERGNNSVVYCYSKSLQIVFK